MIYFGGFLAKLGHYAGFSLRIIYIAGRIRAAVREGDINFLASLVHGRLHGGPYCDFSLTRVRWMGRGAGNIIYQSLDGPVERYTPLVA